MENKDKVKLAVALVVLAGAGVVIYLNLRPSKPGEVVGGSTPQADGGGAPAPNTPPPAGPGRGVFTPKK